jgi:hypothetical protein
MLCARLSTNPGLTRPACNTVTHGAKAAIQGEAR